MPLKMRLARYVSMFVKIISSMTLSLTPQIRVFSASFLVYCCYYIIIFTISYMVLQIDPHNALRQMIL